MLEERGPTRRLAAWKGLQISNKIFAAAVATSPEMTRLKKASLQRGVRLEMTFTINPSAGQTCHLDYHAQSYWNCNHYTLALSTCANRDLIGALLMEAYLTNEADRTSNMDSKSTLSSSTNSDYKGVCTGGAAAGANNAAGPASPSGNLGGASSAVSKGTGSSAKSSASGRPGRYLFLVA
ncbi:hypothetical protein C8J57DRAFT_1240416 [Mycena rebaudengoi]|nr:hypothetical protein C8J57DRAFT_1240416 [Mycena rebaudengoi]